MGYKYCPLGEKYSRVDITTNLFSALNKSVELN